jgi:hypothetical protein
MRRFSQAFADPCSVSAQCYWAGGFKSFFLTFDFCRLPAKRRAKKPGVFAPQVVQGVEQQFYSP